MSRIKFYTFKNKDREVFRDGKKRWRVSRLIQLANKLKTQKMPMSALNIVDLHPNIGDVFSFVAHIKAVMDAELKYPIILNDQGYVMDGRHRIAKAIMLKKKTIKFVRFDNTPDPCEIVSE